MASNGRLENDYLTDMGDDGTATPRKTGNPFHKNDRFRELATDGRMKRVASTILRGPARIFSDQAFMKGPKVGGAKPCHQDNYYFGIDSSDHVMTCWTALDDTDLENVCTIMCLSHPFTGCRRPKSNIVSRLLSHCRTMMHWCHRPAPLLLVHCARAACDSWRVPSEMALFHTRRLSRTRIPRTSTGTLNKLTMIHQRKCQ